jgi:hypothetical protein
MKMLRAIFNKLNMIDYLYIHHLEFVIEQDDIHILDRICSKILPRINEKVKKLTVDPFSMECILDAVDYPQLHSLSLVDYQPEILLQHLKGII